VKARSIRFSFASGDDVEFSFTDAVQAAFRQAEVLWNSIRARLGRDEDVTTSIEEVP
jgi:hypothetical protein